MSFYMTAVPYYYVPHIASASTDMAAAMTRDAVQAAVQNAVSAVETTAAGSSISSSQVAGVTAVKSVVAQEAVSATVSSAAFAAAALPVAVTILTTLAVGMAVEMVRESAENKKTHIVHIPTVFSSHEQLIRALQAWPDGKEYRLTQNQEKGILMCEYGRQKFIFRMNADTGLFDLTVYNAGTCKSVCRQINAIQEKYRQSVREAVVNHLFQYAGQNGWTVESDTLDEEDETRTIRLTW